MCKILREIDSEIGRELIVQRRGVWCFQIMVRVSDNYKPFYDNEKLICKNGDISKVVKDFIDMIEGYDDSNWTLAYYKHLIAFKNPADRVTYIYNKKYFKNRFSLSGDNSIFNCKSIKFD